MITIHGTKLLVGIGIAVTAAFFAAIAITAVAIISAVI